MNGQQRVLRVGTLIAASVCFVMTVTPSGAQELSQTNGADFSRRQTDEQQRRLLMEDGDHRFVWPWNAQIAPIDLSAAPGDSAEFATGPDPGQTDTSGSASVSKTSSRSDLEVTWKTVPRKFLRDEKDLWLFPTQLAKGRHWIPTALLVGGTAILIKEDPPMERSVRQTTVFNDFNKVFKSSVSGGLIAIVPVGFYAVSLIRRDAYDQSTSLLIGEAVAHDTVLMIVMKAVARRARPSEFPPNGLYNDTFFATHNSLLGKGSSFPSGHAMMSFSVASVFAGRYRQHKWVPIVGYALASAISFSRIANGAHFPSDVFIGAGLGYAIGRYDVLRGE